MAAAGDVEQQPVRRIERHGRRIAVAGGGEPQQQTRVGLRIVLRHVEIGDAGPRVGQREAGAEAEPGGAPSHRAETQRAAILAHDDQRRLIRPGAARHPARPPDAVGRQEGKPQRQIAPVFP